MSDPLPVDLIIIPPGKTLIVDLSDGDIPLGAPLSVKSLNGDISSGFVIVTLLS